MPEVQYKFKSSLAFETVQFSEPIITVGALKELINKKQSLKTNGFDLKFKDCNGRVYGGDEEIIDLKVKIIVSRSPKLNKPIISTIKKEKLPINKDNINVMTDVVVPLDFKLSNNDVCKVKDDSEISIRPDYTIVPSPLYTDNIAITPDFLKCTLCHNTMKEATTINCCKKNFCYECITGYLFDPDISGSMECPECKSTVSNYAANVTQNIKLRDIISDIENGKIDVTAASDLLVEPEASEILPNSEIEVEQISVETSGVHIESEIKCDDSVQDINIDNDTNLFDDHLINQISVTEAFEYQIQTYPSQIETITTPDKTVTAKASDMKQSDNNDIYGDKMINDDDCQTQLDNIGNNVPPPCDIQVMPESQWNIDINNYNNQSIKDFDFNPVLYMKFLTIVNEKYPDELTKILSNNIEQATAAASSHTNKDSIKLTSSRHRSRDDDCRDKVPAKKCRRDDDISNDSRYKKTYNGSEKPVGENRNFEETARRTSRSKNTSMNNTGRGNSSSNTSASKGYRPKEQYLKKCNGLPAPAVTAGPGKRYRSRSHSRGPDTRPREYYEQTGPRYNRPQPGPPPSYSDDRRRFNNEYSSSYRDKQRYERRSDR